MIILDAEQVQAKATELRNLRTAHDDNINHMCTLIRTMCNSEIWQGQAASGYLNKLEEMKPVMDQFSAMMEEFASKLDMAASTMTDADVTLAETMNN